MDIRDTIKDFELKIISALKTFKQEDAILIFSDPRGGSTWLTEILMEVPKTAVIWEPLHLKKNNHLKKIGFSWRQFIAEDDPWREAKAEFDSIFTGKRLNARLSHLNKNKDYLVADRLIIKFCRGNALLPWVVNHYDFKMKPIHLVRNPAAVVASQINQGGWDYKYEGFSMPGGKSQALFEPHISFLKTLTTKSESLIALWCITNNVLMKNKNRDRWLTIKYENLFLNPIETLNEIFNQWGIDPPRFDLKRIERESITTKMPVNFTDKQQQLNKWRNQFTNIEIERFQEILNYFEVTEYDLMKK